MHLLQISFDVINQGEFVFFSLSRSHTHAAVFYFRVMNGGGGRRRRGRK